MSSDVSSLTFVANPLLELAVWPELMLDLFNSVTNSNNPISLYSEICER